MGVLADHTSGKPVKPRNPDTTHVPSEGAIIVSLTEIRAAQLESEV